MLLFKAVGADSGEQSGVTVPVASLQRECRNPLQKPDGTDPAGNGSGIKAFQRVEL